jgi:hypothetical protein
MHLAPELLSSVVIQEERFVEFILGGLFKHFHGTRLFSHSVVDSCRSPVSVCIATGLVYLQ